VEHQGKVIVVAMAVPLVQIQRVAVVVDHQPLVRITVVDVAVLAVLELHQAYLVRRYFILAEVVLVLARRVVNRLVAVALAALAEQALVALEAYQLQTEVAAVAVALE